MPGRIGSPTAAISGKRWRSPLASVPVSWPAPGWTTSPAGLATTTTSSSAWTTGNSTGSATGGASASGSPSTSTSSPSARRRLLATGCPPTRTAPASMRAATSARLQPVSSATARSTRSPASEAGTAKRSSGDTPGPPGHYCLQPRMAIRITPMVMAQSATLNVGQWAP